jgi:hypothetical protein
MHWCLYLFSCRQLHGGEWPLFWMTVAWFCILC